MPSLRTGVLACASGQGGPRLKGREKVTYARVSRLRHCSNFSNFVEPGGILSGKLGVLNLRRHVPTAKDKVDSMCEGSGTNWGLAALAASFPLAAPPPAMSGLTRRPPAFPLGRRLLRAFRHPDLEGYESLWLSLWQLAEDSPGSRGWVYGHEGGDSVPARSQGGGDTFWNQIYGGTVAVVRFDDLLPAASEQFYGGEQCHVWVVGDVDWCVVCCGSKGFRLGPQLCRQLEASTLDVHTLNLGHSSHPECRGTHAQHVLAIGPLSSGLALGLRTVQVCEHCKPAAVTRAWGRLPTGPWPQNVRTGAAAALLCLLPGPSDLHLQHLQPLQPLLCLVCMERLICAWAAQRSRVFSARRGPRSRSRAP